MQELQNIIRAQTLALVIVACSPMIALAEAQATPAQDDTSAALANQALQKNPSVAALKFQVRALEERVHKSGAWLDPKVAIELSNIPIDSWTLGDHGMSGLQLKLQQTFLFPGKIGGRKEVARGQVREQRLLLKEREVQLGAAVKRAYYSLALVRQLRQVTANHVALVAQFIGVVRVKYEVGKVGQHDLLRLQLLERTLKDDLKSFQREDEALMATINAALHRALSTPIKTPKRVSQPAPSRTVKDFTSLAIQSRPLLRWYVEQARTRRTAAQQAAREGYPDLTAWIGYRIRKRAGADEGTDFFSVGISVPIPLFFDSRWGSQRRENMARAWALEAQRSAELNRIAGDLGRNIAAWKRAAQKAKAYRDTLMPLAHHTLDATFAAYQVDRADFASLFQAEMQLLNFERAIFRAEARAALSHVEVQALTGTQRREGE
ncbi:MAG: TolC family protein [Deltaproteobacteria bacterium]|nr:TolC family protein [Deltaproteobacteria bacterium]